MKVSEPILSISMSHSKYLYRWYSHQKTTKWECVPKNEVFHNLSTEGRTSKGKERNFSGLFPCEQGDIEDNGFDGDDEEDHDPLREWIHLAVKSLKFNFNF
jgi:hypothetical protein